VKILQLVTRNELRGAEMFAALLSNRLAQHGHEVCFAALYTCPYDTPRLPLNSEVNGVELGGRVKGRIEPGVWVALRRLAKQWRPDVVQANAFHALKYAVLTKRLGGGRWPIVYRNISMASNWIARPWQAWWGRWLFRSVAHVVSVSDASAADLCQTYRFPADRISTVRRGVEVPDSVDRHLARRRLAELIAFDQDDPILFHIGGFTAEKNHVGLLAAFRRIQQELPNSHLVLCGDGPLRERVQNEVRQGGLERQVHLLGNRADAGDLLPAAELLLLTSHVEGIPGVVLEAAVRGVPSVSTNVGAVREAVRDGETGVLVPDGDMPGLARAACDLLADSVRRKAMGEAARSLVAGQHDLNDIVVKWERIYRLVL
jgi:glycosyltransferase involved in cell wall biosynthesis